MKEFIAVLWKFETEAEGEIRHSSIFTYFVFFLSLCHFLSLSCHRFYFASYYCYCQSCRTPTVVGGDRTSTKFTVAKIVCRRQPLSPSPSTPYVTCVHVRNTSASINLITKSNKENYRRLSYFELFNLRRRLSKIVCTKGREHEARGEQWTVNKKYTKEKKNRIFLLLFEAIFMNSLGDVHLNFHAQIYISQNLPNIILFIYTSSTKILLMFFSCFIRCRWPFAENKCVANFTFKVRFLFN